MGKMNARTVRAQLGKRGNTLAALLRLTIAWSDHIVHKQESLPVPIFKLITQTMSILSVGWSSFVQAMSATVQVEHSES